MSVRVIEQRYCDVCERDYDPDKPDWMVLSAPNAPEGIDAQWDFCSYACLTTWFSDEEETAESLDAKLEEGTPVEVVTTRTPEQLAEAQARLDAAMQQVDTAPPMTLMEAIASGKLDFARGPE